MLRLWFQEVGWSTASSSGRMLDQLHERERGLIWYERDSNKQYQNYGIYVTTNSVPELLDTPPYIPHLNGTLVGIFFIDCICMPGSKMLLSDWLDVCKLSETQKLTKHPHITGCSKTSEVNGFWRHPLNGKLPLASLIITLVLHPTTQAEVGQLHAVVSWH